MGQLGSYIDEMCRDHPDAMRKVIDVEFCSFSCWGEPGDACLVGSIRVARGLAVKADSRSGWQGQRDAMMGGRAAQVARRRGVEATRRQLAYNVDAYARFTPFMSREMILRKLIEGQSAALCGIGTKLLSPVIKRRIQRRLATPPADFKLQFPARERPAHDMICYANQFLAWCPALPAEPTFSG